MVTVGSHFATNCGKKAPGSVYHEMRLAYWAISAASTVRALNCSNIQSNGDTWNIEPLFASNLNLSVFTNHHMYGDHLVSTDEWNLFINLCRPLDTFADIAKEDQCPPGAYACRIGIRKRNSMLIL